MANLDAKARDRARDLRKQDTQAERLLWEALRARRLGGFKFIRQLAIGPHFADFAAVNMGSLLKLMGQPMAVKLSWRMTERAAHI